MLKHDTHTYERTKLDAVYTYIYMSKARKMLIHSFTIPDMFRGAHLFWWLQTTRARPESITSHVYDFNLTVEGAPCFDLATTHQKLPVRQWRLLLPCQLPHQLDNYPLTTTPWGVAHSHKTARQTGEDLASTCCMAVQCTKMTNVPYVALLWGNIACGHWATWNSWPLGNF